MEYKLDENHQQIVKAFQTLGCLVIDNAKVKRHEGGQPDICVGLPNPFGGLGIWIWVEIKTNSGPLGQKQQAWINDAREHGLPVEIVRNTFDVEWTYNKYLKLMEILQ